MKQWPHDDLIDWIVHPTETHPMDRTKKLLSAGHTQQQEGGFLDQRRVCRCCCAQRSRGQAKKPSGPPLETRAAHVLFASSLSQSIFQHHGWLEKRVQGTSRVTRCAWGVVGIIIWSREVVFFPPMID